MSLTDRPRLRALKDRAWRAADEIARAAAPPQPYTFNHDATTTSAAQARALRRRNLRVVQNTERQR